MLVCGHSLKNEAISTGWNPSLWKHEMHSSLTFSWFEGKKITKYSLNNLFFKKYLLFVLFEREQLGVLDFVTMSLIIWCIHLAQYNQKGPRTVSAVVLETEVSEKCSFSWTMNKWVMWKRMKSKTNSYRTKSFSLVKFNIPIVLLRFWYDKHHDWNPFRDQRSILAL